MMLTLTDEQFAMLLNLAYLGEVVMNDWTAEDERTEENELAAELLYELCEKASGTDLVHSHPETGEWVPSDALRAHMQQHLRFYDEEVFWDELIHRLARRDLADEYGEEALEHLSDAHFRKADESLIAYYDQEVRTRGTDRLYIREA